MKTINGDRFIVNNYPQQLNYITNLHPLGYHQLYAQGHGRRYTLYDVNLLPL